MKRIRHVDLGSLILDAQPGFASGRREADGVIQVRMNNVNTVGKLDMSQFIRVPADEVSLDRYSLRPNDVLFNHTNSRELVGKSAVFPGFDEQVTFSNHFLRLRVDEKEVDPRVLVAWLTQQWRNGVFEVKCNSWVNQSTVPTRVLLGLKMPLPPLEAQKRIADALDKAQELIDKRKQQIEMLDEFLQSVFLDMFGDPVSNPKGWQSQLLGDLIIGKPKNGLYKPANQYTKGDNGTPILRIDSFYNGKPIDFNSLKRLNCTSGEIERYKLRHGDIVINRVNSLEYLGKCGLVNEPLEDTVFESNMMRIQVDTSLVRPVYLATALASTFTYAQIMKCAKKAVNQASINQGDVCGLIIRVPPLVVQDQFAYVVQRIECQREAMEISLLEMENAFNSIMQRAFKGELFN